MDPIIDSPQWVIVGGCRPDGSGVVLLASTEITRADLEAFADRPEICDLLARPHPGLGLRLVLAVSMTRFVYVWGDTWEEALRYLFNQWEPPRGRHAIANRPAIEDALGG